MVNKNASAPSVPRIQGHMVAPERTQAPGHDGPGGLTAKRSIADIQKLADVAAGHEPPGIDEADGRHAAIIEALLRRCGQKRPQSQDPTASQVDGHSRLLKFLARISGCGWLRGQFNSDIQLSGTLPPQPARKAAQPQNGQCAACQSDLPQADRFCAELAGQALEWREAEALIDCLARRIAEGLGASATKVVEETEVISARDFEGFANRHYPHLMRYYRFKNLELEDAQDLIQETFLVFWQRRNRSTPSHRLFLFGIARRLYYAFLRSRKVCTTSLNEFPEDNVVCPDGQQEETDGDSTPDHGKLVAELLARTGVMSQSQRKVIQLRYAEGLSLRQTADKLGLSASSVQIHERRGLAALRRLTGLKKS